jgi:pilus assembly protein Flp/PilA
MSFVKLLSNIRKGLAKSSHKGVEYRLSYRFTQRSYAMLFVPREEGQGLVEYALILVLVAVVVIAILTLLGPAIGNVFSSIVQSV